MTTYSVYEVKAHFATVLRLVESGETVIVTRHGKPVAEIRPVKPPKRKVVTGAFEGEFQLSDDAFAPLAKAELKDWYAN